MADRLSHEPVEALYKTNAGKARVSHEPVEALYATNAGKNRVSHIPVEVLYAAPSAKARVSQQSEETLTTPPSDARLSQVAVEALAQIPGRGDRLSQVAVEALGRVPSRGDRLSQLAVEVLMSSALPFIGSHTTVYAPTLVSVSADINVPFIGSNTTVYPLVLAVNVPFIGSHTVVYSLSLGVNVPFIPSHTHVYGVASLYDPDLEGVGPGNGGEMFLIRLAPNGVTVSSTLVNAIGVGSGVITLADGTDFPHTRAFELLVDDELIYVSWVGANNFIMRRRGLGNSTVVSHLAGASASWGDHYDMAIACDVDIAHNFTADINSTGSFTYPGWLICFDSTQAYNAAGDRYPMHVTSVLGVFDAGAGVGGTSRCDGAQPNAICTPTGVSDECPAALSNPARIASDIAPGDVAVIRYQNPEAYVLDLWSRSAALQSWFGMMRVDESNVDVTLTEPDAFIVDSHPADGRYSFDGSINVEAGDPIPLAYGIAKDSSHDAGFAVATPGLVPWLTTTMPGTDRWFTYPPHGLRSGWPIGALAVRQGKRRVPYWESWDWHNYNFVYSGWDNDATYVQMIVNRYGIVVDSVPEVELPGTQDINGPDVYWDDANYFVGSSWYIALYNGPYIVFGPVIGDGGSGASGGGGGGYVPVVGFPGGVPTIRIPFIEGGSGG